MIQYNIQPYSGNLVIFTYYSFQKLSVTRIWLEISAPNSKTYIAYYLCEKAFSKTLTVFEITSAVFRLNGSLGIYRRTECIYTTGKVAMKHNNNIIS